MSKFSDLAIPPRLWELVERGNGNEATMRSLLEQLHREDLLLFYKEFSFAVDELQGYLEGCDVEIPECLDSEAFGWVIAQGKAFCERLFAHPELIETISSDQITEECVYDGVAIAVYETIFGSPMPNTFEIKGRWPI